MKELFSAWCCKMAWRDTRTSRKRLLLFSFSIVLGIAALAAIGSLGVNLERAIEEQAKGLLGADLQLGSREAFPPAAEELIQKLGGEQSRGTSLSTMIYFVHGDGTRLVNLRGLEGGFPFYGELETDPPAAAETFRHGGALLEDNLLTQFNAKVGDTIRLGNLTTTIVGRLKKVPGESVALGSIAPRVYVGMEDFNKAGLLRAGSIASYDVWFKFPAETNVTELAETNKPQFDALRLRYETVAKRKEDLGKAMENLYHFLNLTGFIALLLGAVGVASAIHAHVTQKLPTVALLRCLGASIAQTFAIYLIQGMGLGLLGAMAGAVLGVAIQAQLPKILVDFIPFHFQFATSWMAVGRAMFTGFVICILFALLPLLPVRRISPLVAIRASFESAKQKRDPLRWLFTAILGLGVAGFAWAQTHDWRIALGFAAGLGVAFLIIAATAAALIFFTRKLTLPGLPFVVRQGLANLHRPNNRTLLLLLALGLGTFLMLSLYLVQHTLLTQLISANGHDQPNTVLFDIQPDEREPVSALVKSMGLPVLDEVPMVTMRLVSLKGVTVESLLAEKTNHVPRWALRREYRSTYSDHLRDGEKIVAGTWHPKADEHTNVYPVSVEEGLAKDLHLKLNDRIVFDVQGVMVTNWIASLRSVDWRRIQPNFFVVFPAGVLEEAPAMDVLMTRATPDESAKLQREVVKQFPNVSTIDLQLVLQALDAIIGKISFVIRFMALFTVVTGLLVLAGALLTGRYQRIQESILLRTLGASRQQVLRILLVEYFALGLLSAATGIVLAVAEAWAVCKFVFETHFALEPLALLVTLVVLPALTIITGMLMSRGVLNRPPLKILRGT